MLVFFGFLAFWIFCVSLNSTAAKIKNSKPSPSDEEIGKKREEEK